GSVQTILQHAGPEWRGKGIMRIGIMCHASLGGSVRIATGLSDELARRGHRVHLFTLGAPFGAWGSASGVVQHQVVSPDCPEARNPSTLHTEWSSVESQAFMSCILAVLEGEGLDILHFHYAVPFAFLAGDLRDLRGDDSPVLVGTLHGTDVSILGCDPIKGPILSQALKKMDALTTVSVSHSRLAANVLWLPDFPEVIPNFVDIGRFRPSHAGEPDELVDRHAEGRTGEHRRPRIAHVSNLRPIKDLETVAHIFVGIRERMDAELWLVGDGPEMETTRSIVEQKGYANDVVSWGLRENVAPILARADLLVMPSLSESFCLAALEAMACGVPVLATSVGGLPEVVLHGKTGFLFPLRDPSMGVRLAVHLLSDRQLHSQMAKAAAEHARRFSQGEIVSRYEDLSVDQGAGPCRTGSGHPGQPIFPGDIERLTGYPWLSLEDGVGHSEIGEGG
ncbi:MAG: N-acetyl-alpha-D-glucosaminyl L-malate synthase BshA, partial [Chloroflexi bacterium]|nr:N-acetyl-alpha-D-glucosaminyl L-malate synthase BshA [Chloroflexota bacterium]